MADRDGDGDLVPDDPLPITTVSLIELRYGETRVRHYLRAERVLLEEEVQALDAHSRALVNSFEKWRSQGASRRGAPGMPTEGQVVSYLQYRCSEGSPGNPDHKLTADRADFIMHTLVMGLADKYSPDWAPFYREMFEKPLTNVVDVLFEEMDWQGHFSEASQSDDRGPALPLLLSEIRHRPRTA